ncbi:hypothetical protein [Streptomyces alfalfae]
MDVRVETADEKDRIEAAFVALAPHLEVAVIEVRGGVGRPPMPEPAPAELFAIASRLLPGIEAVGGVSDGDFTAALRVPTLDGLGAVGGGAHADHKYLLVENMGERANLVTGFMTAIRTA